MSLNRNIQNKSGMTALDALRANGPRHMNRDTEKLIQNAGGKSGNSLSKVKKTSVFLRKSITFSEYCFTRIARYRSGMSDGTRNTLLVIAALIIAATYQIALQPIDKEKYLNLSVMEIIVDFVVLWGLNTIAFLLAIATTFVLLPVGRSYTWWFIFISGPLVCGVPEVSLPSPSDNLTHACGGCIRNPHFSTCTLREVEAYCAEENTKTQKRSDFRSLKRHRLMRL
ncbi:unnamed protein product [Thlaspi arvense]|uniref:PGG domain-containing protein n=1 Tax=Thlaspi arvense TaxID=13288 RepID=A0AAU9T584_THLAR|nr:unnamed protein product [Thlaspi arvense]